MKNKALIVAVSEFTTLVQSKAFIVGLLMMPVFMVIAMSVQKFTKDATDVKDRPFVVVDRTGVLYGPLKAAADDWNRASAATGVQTQPRFLPSEGHLEGGDEQARAALSDRVKRDELYAFVEIPAEAMDPDAKTTMRYYSNHPALSHAAGWIARRVNREILNRASARARSIARS
jgi:hypothetical protein